MTDQLTEPNPERVGLAQLVRYQREAAHLSVDSLARATSSSPSTIFRLEAGRTQRPKPSLIAAIARELRIDSDEIEAAIPDDPGLASEINARLISGVVSRYTTHAPTAGDQTLIAFNQDGAIINVVLKNAGEHVHRAIIDTLKELDFTLTTPIQ